MKTLLLLILFSGQTALASPLTLADAFKSALEKNESAGIAKSQVLQADERLTQAFGQLLPKISLVGTYLKQDAPAGSSGSLSPDQWNAKFTLTQPLFHGLTFLKLLLFSRRQTG